MTSNFSFGFSGVGGHNKLDWVNLLVFSEASTI